jgi:hypothetical protein
MRVQLHIDFELSRPVKRALKFVVPALVLFVGGVALAGVPNVFNTGDVLSATAMNANFTNLDTRLSRLEALAGTADGGTGAVGGTVVWADTTGAIMPVVRVKGDAEGGGFPFGFEILDPTSNAIFAWQVTSPAQGPTMSLNANPQQVFVTGNCTGTPYVSQLPVQGYAFHVSGDSTQNWYRVPDDVTVVQGAFASYGSSSSCQETGGSSFLLPLSSLAVVTPPTAPPGVPPYHPVTVP